MKVFNIRQHPIIAILLNAKFNILKITKCNNLVGCAYIVDMNNRDSSDEIVRIRITKDSYAIREYSIIDANELVLSGNVSIRDLNNNYSDISNTQCFIQVGAKFSLQLLVTEMLYTAPDCAFYSTDFQYDKNLLNYIGDHKDCNVYIIYKDEHIKIGNVSKVEIKGEVSTSVNNGQRIPVNITHFNLACKRYTEAW